jgi:hypothetical protein
MVAGTVDTGKWHQTPTPLQQYKMEILIVGMLKQNALENQEEIKSKATYKSNCTK